MGRLADANAVKRVEITLALADAEVSTVISVAAVVVVKVSRPVVVVTVNTCYGEPL